MEFGGNYPVCLVRGLSPAAPRSSRARTLPIFLQDAWRVMPNLTLKLGVRYDLAKYDTDNATQIADMSKWQPRVGAAWDITGDAKNIVRANWGYFMSPNALTLPNFARTGIAPRTIWLSCSYFFGFDAEGVKGLQASAASRGAWTPRTGTRPVGFLPRQHLRRPAEPDRPRPQGDVHRDLQPRLRARGRPAGFGDPDLHRQEDQGHLRGHLRRQLAQARTRTASCDYYVMANLPELTRDYSGFVIEYNTRTFNWLTLNASYTYSKSKGSQEYNQNSGTDFDVYPAHYDNRYGYLSDHRANRFKLNGFFTIKGDWTIGFDGFYSSAFTWQPTANSGNDGEDLRRRPFRTTSVERYLLRRAARQPRGQLELPARPPALQGLHGRQRGSARADRLGLQRFSSPRRSPRCASRSTAAPTPTATSPTPAVPTNWQTPRRYELGFRVEF